MYSLGERHSQTACSNVTIAFLCIECIVLTLRDTVLPINPTLVGFIVTLSTDWSVIPEVEKADNEHVMGNIQSKD